MEWGLAVLAIQILLLVVGWFLFLQARTDLTARAAQMPVLSEVKSLEQSISALLEQLRLESVQTSAQLEARCLEARDLLATLDRRLEEIRQVAQRSGVRRRTSVAQTAAAAPDAPTGGGAAADGADARIETICALADQGIAAAEIAQRTGASEGEVELVLGLRSAGADS